MHTEQIMPHSAGAGDCASVGDEAAVLESEAAVRLPSGEAARGLGGAASEEHTPLTQ